VGGSKGNAGSSISNWRWGGRELSGRQKSSVRCQNWGQTGGGNLHSYAIEGTATRVAIFKCLYAAMHALNPRSTNRTSQATSGDICKYKHTRTLEKSRMGCGAIFLVGRPSLHGVSIKRVIVRDRPRRPTFWGRVSLPKVNEVLGKGDYQSTICQSKGEYTPVGHDQN